MLPIAWFVCPYVKHTGELGKNAELIKMTFGRIINTHVGRKPRIRWTCTFAEWQIHWTIHAWQRCGFLSNYFSRLLTVFTVSSFNTHKVNSALHPSVVAKLSTSFAGVNVTSARWQVTLCDLMWHVSSRSSETGCTSAKCLLTYVNIFHCYSSV